LGIYLIITKEKFGKYFLVFGALTFSSMIGTFTHLHTPLLVSLERTVYGIIIGAGVGLIYIGVWYVMKKYIYTPIKERFIT
ncbi:DUF5693 family protein, partial [Pseudomonas sp. 2822-15]|uniref:DUF5693 family protein n=1 Tax=Pseudomonas sp. 2822-15 TaxID=1712677 RepID=UPI001C4841CD